MLVQLAVMRRKWKLKTSTDNIFQKIGEFFRNVLLLDKLKLFVMSAGISDVTVQYAVRRHRNRNPISMHADCRKTAGQSCEVPLV